MKKMLMVSIGLCALMFVSENGYAQNKVVGEVNYKREEQKSSKKDIDVTFVMLGLQYSF
ncbi:MAG: hypothetical protein ACRCVB_05950 [Cetobacterium sp.]